ncbi:hypothetical protein [Acidiphilium sp. C61]|jgi:succinate dehydrogenase/fumarate reductase flavoprotein subunit|uniref:hypothetical protein n=1 Tax=Acidiphilium sp. C61 TaxID=1671485 RepID=UPI00157BB221|nr:hypothetical protein [Acidiphilium sp. C61]
MNTETSPCGPIAAADALAAILEEENRRLSLHDFAASATLEAAKRGAIAAFEAAMEAGAKLPPRERRQAEAAQRRLEKAVSANGALLRDAIETQQRVIRTVMQALDNSRAAVEPLQSYAQDAAGRPVPPVAFNLRA